MADQEKKSTNFQLYGAIFVLILYFGGISPWEEEIAELREQVNGQEQNAKNPSRFVSKAKIAKNKLEKKKKQFVNFLSNLPSSDETHNDDEISVLDRFNVAIEACKKYNVSVPDIAPVSKIENKYFQASGCSFTLESKNERTLYKLLRTVRLDDSQPRIRFLEMSYGTGRGNAVRASVTLAWPTYKKAGLSVVSGIKTTSVNFPDNKSLDKWAIFTDRPKISTIKRSNSKYALESSSRTKGTSKLSGSRGPSGSSSSKDKVTGGKGKATDKKSAVEVVSSLKGVTLLGTISIAGIDGIIVPAGGSQKIILVGESYKGWTLLSVDSEKARLKNKGRVVEMKLIRKTLLGDSPNGQSPVNKDPNDSGSTVLAKIPQPKQLGLHAVMTLSRKIDGGRNIVGSGFRRGMLVKKVDEDSLAQESRIISGDFIYMINSKAVRTPTQLRVAASQISKNKDVTFMLLRKGVSTEIVCSN